MCIIIGLLAVLTRTQCFRVLFIQTTIRSLPMYLGMLHKDLMCSTAKWITTCRRKWYGQPPKQIVNGCCQRRQLLTKKTILFVQLYRLPLILHPRQVSSRSKIKEESQYISPRIMSNLDFLECLSERSFSTSLWQGINVTVFVRTRHQNLENPTLGKLLGMIWASLELQ